MADGEAVPGDLRGRHDRYAEASVLGKAALRISGAALSPAEREQLRRHELGVEGRIAEDAVHAVEASVPVWAMLAEKGMFEDLTVAELNHIGEDLLGRPVDGVQDVARIDVSLKFTDADHIALLRKVIPGDLHPEVFNAYRYATLTPGSFGAPEPFIIALSDDDSGVNDVVAAMLIASTFLLHEQDLGAFEAADLRPLEAVLHDDLAAIRETHRLLREA
jgi:hypothetical protein